MQQSSNLKDSRKHTDPAEGDRETVEESIRIHELRDEQAGEKAEPRQSAPQKPHKKSSDEELTSVLRDLAATCRDAEEGFHKAAKGAHSDELRALFDDYAAQRAKFAAELDDIVKQYGAVPGDRGHGSGPLRRGWRELEARIRPKGDAEFMIEAADGEESGLKHYDRALAMDLPEGVRQVLEKHRGAMERSVMEFRAGAGVEAR